MTRHQRRIKELLAEKEKLKAEIQGLKEDRDKYRDWTTAKLKWFLELIGSQKTPNLPWLVEDVTKLLNRCQKFYW